MSKYRQKIEKLLTLNLSSFKDSKNFTKKNIYKENKFIHAIEKARQLGNQNAEDAFIERLILYFKFTDQKPGGVDVDNIYKEIDTIWLNNKNDEVRNDTLSAFTAWILLEMILAEQSEKKPMYKIDDYINEAMNVLN